MSFSKSAILSLILTSGCLVENTNHCSINATVCAVGQTCNVGTGRCETGATPIPQPVAFSITGVSPAVIPPMFDYSTGMATITTVGMPKSKIVKVKIDQQAPIDITMQTDMPSGSQLVFPMATLDALTKCGPLDISVVDEAGVEYPAPSEMFGRFYRHWLYSQTREGSRSKVKDFDMNPLASEPFDFMYSDADGPKLVVTGNFAHKFYGPYITDMSDFSTVKYSVSSNGKSAVSTANNGKTVVGMRQLVGNGQPLAEFEPCNGYSIYTYAGFTVFSEGLNRYVQAVCELPINSAKGRSIYLNTVGIAGEIGSQRSYPRDYMDSGFYAISYPSTPGTLGALIAQKIPALSGYSIVTVDHPNRESDYSNEMAITGVLPAVFSLGLPVSGTTGDVLHFVASTDLSKGLIAIQLFKGSRFTDVTGNMAVKQAGSLLKTVDPLTFGEDRNIPTEGSSPIGIEVRDINCDNIKDIILRTNRFVVAYLGTDSYSFNWDSPKVLFKTAANDANSGIKKQALWVPTYQRPDDRGVLGILDRSSTLQMYQQE